MGNPVEFGHHAEARHFGIDALGELHAFLNRGSGQLRAVCRQQKMLEYVFLQLVALDPFCDLTQYTRCSNRASIGCAESGF